MTGIATGRFVLLLRGINVNPTTRVAMADLRDILTGLGFRNVNTVLQSGNVILESDSVPDTAAIESAITKSTGVKSSIVMLTVEELRALALANPLLNVSDDLSKLVITFLGDAIDPTALARPADAELAPERLVVTKRAIYQWCPLGILQSQLKPGWWRQVGPVVTARNVRTVNRILRAADFPSSIPTPRG
jgi:uncharacterized protein (DUF1697 family)